MMFYNEFVCGDYCPWPRRVMSTRDVLMRETIEADAAMLLAHLNERAQQGNMTPITTREALAVIHRKQPEDRVIDREAAHVLRVMTHISTLVSRQESPGSEA